MAVFGDTLRQARAYKGVTLKEAEQATRINRHHLAALEDENFGVLPPLIYQRGIVRNYATYLDLDPGKLLPMFEEARGGEATAELVAAVKPLDMPSHWAPNFAIIAFLVVMSAIVFAWVYSASFADSRIPATVSSQPLPTVTPVANLALADVPSPTSVPAVVTPRQSEVSATSSRQADVSAAIPSPTPRAIVREATSTPKPSPTARTVAVVPTIAATVASAAPTGLVETPLPLRPEPAREASVIEPAVTATAEPEFSGAEPGMDTIRVIADGPIYVTVETGSGEVLFSGELAAGTATDYFTAPNFLVTTSDGSLTRFENPNVGGEPFYMGYGADETYPLG